MINGRLFTRYQEPLVDYLERKMEIIIDKVWVDFPDEIEKHILPLTLAAECLVTITRMIAYASSSNMEPSVIRDYTECLYEWFPLLFREVLQEGYEEIIAIWELFKAPIKQSLEAF